MTDFVDVAPVAGQYLVLVVGSSSGMKSVSGVIADAKARPGEIKFGYPGIGSIAHLTAEKFYSAAGIEVVHTPYKGGPETVAAIREGYVTYALLPLARISHQASLRNTVYFQSS